MLDYMNRRAIPGPWPASERIMVAISSHPLGEKLVRTASRLAERLHAEWYAVYVETPDRLPVSAAYTERGEPHPETGGRAGGQNGFHLGAIRGQSGDRICPPAKHEPRIIAGKPLRPRWIEAIAAGLSLTRLSVGAGTIDIYIVSEKRAPYPAQPPGLHSRGPLVNYLKSI